MNHRPLAMSLLFVIAAAPLSVAHAQHSAGTAPRVLSVAPAEAAQFAFLIGQWSVKVSPKATTLATKIHGMPKLTGTWKAWRSLDGFGIEDELRIVDGSGNPNNLTHTLRMYDAAQARWVQTGFDVYRGRTISATGTWSNGAMELRSEGRDAEGKTYTQRTRIYDITPTSFKYQADRSLDDGKTWDAGVLKMEATRTAATAPR